MKIPENIHWEPTGKTLGEGGQSQVYLVKDKNEKNGHIYALKALKRNEPGQAYERFYREIEVIKKLNHPNIIKIIDNSKPDADFHYYVMEYIERARTLQKVMKFDNSPFYCDPIATLNLFEQICSALMECEYSKTPVVHRDLSPKNILILPYNSIKIIDFGVCQIEGDTTITLVDDGVGTVNYMAPECESGSQESIGIGADLYSAGKILWSAITGQLAFARENPVFTVKSMYEMFPKEPLTWHLYHIFEKTIRRDKRERWGSAESAVNAARFVKNLIKFCYKPLENLFYKCPICGVGELKDFNGSHIVFGNPNPRGIIGQQCSYCGVCLAINYDKIHKLLNDRKVLE